ncbi:hypothetical protein [Stenotrophomonas sp. 278]|uniref:hypothetical protein n=1 Tax=Stenotrophomonas sp. 278 TaxID=2479851 RepID=UPI000F671A0F|nr:hypothetical protein [Stenotrophomonas sp. 278]RRU06416.1 hypothetical protein EGJ34_17195 [Stenotrophomonas sp. 278]
MQKPISEDALAQRIAWSLGATFEVRELGAYSLSNQRFGLDMLLPVDAFAAVFSDLAKYTIADETALVSDTTYEILVQEESPHHFRKFREDKLCVSEEDDGIEYELSPASDAYLTWLLSTVQTQREMRDLGFGYLSGMRFERMRIEIESSSPFDILRAVSVYRFLTLKIRAKSKASVRRFQQLSSSFLFHIAFNLDVALVQVRFLEELSSRGRINRMRRSKVDEIDPPRRMYNEDLVAHYVLAVSTDSPSVQFLSYYHVLEHFFESIFNDELVDKVKSQITHPAFSYRRKKDVVSLIDQIKRSLQIRSETITFSESEALRLTLTRYVDVSELASRINEYSPSLVEYYRSNEVAFSKAPAVDLTSHDHELVIRTLGRRIYATRNALVHSKDGDKQRYTPFKDERELLSEVPLLRFISEQVIVGTST